MARINNLTDFLTDIANSIRAKKGYSSSTKISAENFDTEVSDIPTVNNEDKTITENGTYTAGQNYTGLGQVIVNVPNTAQITCDFSKLGTGSASQNTITTCITDIDNIDIPSNIQSLQYFFAASTSGPSFLQQTLVHVGTFDLKNVTNLNGLFYNQTHFQTAPELDTSNVQLFNNAFQRCSALANVPIYDLSSATNFTNMYDTKGDALTNTSLQNILKSLLTLNPSYSGTKTLANMGLTSAQASTCTTFTEWTTLSADGWTTGY